jgi:hypothetical protein
VSALTGLCVGVMDGSIVYFACDGKYNGRLDIDSNGLLDQDRKKAFSYR